MTQGSSASGHALDAGSGGARIPDRTRAYRRAVAAGSPSLRLRPERAGEASGRIAGLVMVCLAVGCWPRDRRDQPDPRLCPADRVELACGGVPGLHRPCRRERRVAPLASRGAAPDSGCPADACLDGEPSRLRATRFIAREDGDAVRLEKAFRSRLGVGLVVAVHAAGRRRRARDGAGAAGAGFRDHQGVRRRCLEPLLGRSARCRTHEACMQNKMGQLPKPCLDKLLDAMAGSSFKVCKDQTYALCAAARCNVYDGVAYCQCEEKHGDSISLPFPMGKGVDVCAVNAAGADNKYMVSTYSLPEQIASPQGGGGVYTCSGGSSGGAYAQCDGGLCFKSTEETTFPGFDKPVPKGQIICSCPITDASSGSAQGYQILGPYPCDKSFFKYCKSDVANSNTGSTIYVGAPIGTAAA